MMNTSLVTKNWTRYEGKYVEEESCESPQREFKRIMYIVIARLQRFRFNHYTEKEIEESMRNSYMSEPTPVYVNSNAGQK